VRSEIVPWMVRGFALAGGVALLIAVLLVGISASRVFILVFVAVLLASALGPIIGRLRGFGIGRRGAILLVYAVFLVVVLGFAFVIVPAAIAQAELIIAALPPFIDEARRGVANLRPEALATSITALLDAFDRAIGGGAAPPHDPEEVVEVGLTVAEAAISVASLLAIVFFWLLERARLQRYTLAFLPAARRAGARDTWNDIETRLGLWVRGQLILMGSIAAATGIAYSLLGLPSALLLALIAGLSEAIPIVGPAIGAIPAILVAATISPEMALLVAGVYVVIQIVEGNVLVPLVMRNAVGISPFLVIVSLLVGAAAGGIIGALLAVPIVASLEIILARLQARRVAVAQEPGALVSDAEPDDDVETGIAPAEPPLPPPGVGRPSAS
jgi:predicted PurR-regulated permease PerM